MESWAPELEKEREKARQSGLCWLKNAPPGLLTLKK